MKLVYVGERVEAVDVPRARIVNWKRGEARDVPDELAASLLERPEEFREAEETTPQRQAQAIEDVKG